MPEYIEREATCIECIHSDICRHIPTLTGWDALNPVYCMGFRSAANVVEVVRCKDCKHGEVCCNLQGEEYVVCELDEHHVWIPNGFCSYGERRERNE